MTIEEKANALAALAEKYGDYPEKMAAFKANPVATLKEAGLEITQDEYDKILSIMVTTKGKKCSLF